MTATMPRAFAVWFAELERWDVLSAWLRKGFAVSHPLRPLGEIVQVRTERATDEQLQNGEVNMVDRVSFDGELFAGERQQTRMEQFIALPGDVVVSKIRARQGSIGLVYPEHGKVSVTIHYRVLQPNAELVDGMYVWMALRSSYCRAQFLAATGGAMKGEISEEALLEIKIALPPLPVQRAIVARWQQAQQQIAAARQRSERVKADMDTRFLQDLGLKPGAQAQVPKVFVVAWKDLFRWSISYNQAVLTGADITRGKYSLAPLGSLLEFVQYGTSEKANTKAHGVPVLRINNIKDRVIDLSSVKHVPLPDKTLKSLLLADGDILVIRTSGSRDLVGTCAAFHAKGDYVFASYLIRLRVHSDKADPDFVAWLMNSPIGRQQVDTLSRHIMQNNINSEELRSLQIPLPPLPVQRAIVERIAEARAAIAREQETAARLARETETEVEAMILGTKTV